MILLLSGLGFLAGGGLGAFIGLCAALLMIVVHAGR